MDQLFHDWNFEDNFHLSTNKRSIRPEDELVELLWRDGQVVLQSQARREPQNQTLNPKPILNKQETLNPKPNNTFLTPQETLNPKPNNSFLTPQETLNPKPNNTFLNPQETVSWIQYPPDDVDPFESDFSSHFFSSIGPNHPIEETIKHETQTMAPPKFKSSLTTLGPSHCSSNQPLVNQKGINKNVDQNANANANADTSSGGSSGCSYGLKNSAKESGSGRSITLDRKRKHVIDTTDQESVSQSDLQSISTDDQIGNNKSNQRSGSTRRSRAAEVHNLSERRRRDRINERMKALQELIPHCSKTDKASILDEAIDYLKSLQMQLQVMWMGSGMAAAAAAAATVTTPMMLPSSPYLGQIGMQAPMQLPQFPVINGSAPPNHPGLLCQNPVQFQLQAQNRVLSEQLARYMGGFQQMPLATPQVSKTSPFM